VYDYYIARRFDLSPTALLLILYIAPVSPAAENSFCLIKEKLYLASNITSFTALKEIIFVSKHSHLKIASVEDCFVSFFAIN